VWGKPVAEWRNRRVRKRVLAQTIPTTFPEKREIFAIVLYLLFFSSRLSSLLGVVSEGNGTHPDKVGAYIP